MARSLEDVIQKEIVDLECFGVIQAVIGIKYGDLERFDPEVISLIIRQIHSIEKDAKIDIDYPELETLFNYFLGNHDMFEKIDKIGREKAHKMITELFVENICGEWGKGVLHERKNLLELYKGNEDFFNNLSWETLYHIFRTSLRPVKPCPDIDSIREIDDDYIKEVLNLKSGIEILDKRGICCLFSQQRLDSICKLAELYHNSGKIGDIIFEEIRGIDPNFECEFLDAFFDFYSKNYSFFKLYGDVEKVNTEVAEFILELAKLYDPRSYNGPYSYQNAQEETQKKAQEFIDIFTRHSEVIISGIKNIYPDSDIVAFLRREFKKESHNIDYMGMVFRYIAEKQCDNFEDILECAKLSLQRYGILENYDVVKKLGSGAFKRVYLAKNRATDKQEVIKILDKNKLGEYLQQKVGWTDAELLKHEFRQEELKKLNNQNISRIEHIGFYSGRYFIIEEYFKKTLEDVLKEKKKFCLSETIDYIMQIATALKAAHSLERPLSHGDLNLANIGITDGIIKVTDFGFASSIRYDPEIRKINVGAISSRAPELYKNLTPTAQSDVWSIGVLMYRMLSGNFPFYYGTYADSKQREECEKNAYKDICDKLSGSKKICDAPNTPEEIKGSPLEIQDVLNKCIIFDPKQRFQDTGKLYKVLKSINPTRYEIDLKRREFTTKEWMGDLESERRVIAARSRGVPLPMTEFWVLSVPLKYFNSKEDDVIRHNMGREYHPELKKFGLEHLGLSFFIEEVILPDLDGVKPKDPTYNFGKIGRFKINDVKVEGDRIIISSHAYPEIDSSHSPNLKP